MLTDEECVICDAPDLRDVDVMCRILEGLEAKVQADFQQNTLRLHAADMTKSEAPFDLAKRMRASILDDGADSREKTEERESRFPGAVPSVRDRSICI